MLEYAREQNPMAVINSLRSFTSKSPTPKKEWGYFFSEVRRCYSWKKLQPKQLVNLSFKAFGPNKNYTENLPATRHRIMRHHGGFQLTREPAKVQDSSQSSCKLLTPKPKLISKVDENFEWNLWKLHLFWRFLPSAFKKIKGPLPLPSNMAESKAIAADHCPHFSLTTMPIPPKFKSKRSWKRDPFFQRKGSSWNHHFSEGIYIC